MTNFEYVMNIAVAANTDATAEEVESFLTRNGFDPAAELSDRQTLDRIIDEATERAIKEIFEGLKN